jgi:hypothetical protein
MLTRTATILRRLGRGAADGSVHEHGVGAGFLRRVALPVFVDGEDG